jgi:NAD-dependent dihydropyrimidine dehydrogenase PreA subunit
VDVITIDVERCTGCGACLEVCPTGALYLVDGKATVDEARCRVCDACLAACPTVAITLAPQAEPVRMPALRPEPEAIRIRTQPAPLRFRVLPVAGAALVWAGREILPRLADFLLYTLDRQTTAPRLPGTVGSRDALAPGAKGSGQQHRHRQRGGKRPARNRYNNSSNQHSNKGDRKKE